MGVGEFMLIAVVGLLVLGPERLPVAIRTVSEWISSIKQMASAVTTEISQELKASELHQNLKKAEQHGLENLSPELHESVQVLKDAAASVTRQYEEASSSVSSAVNRAVSDNNAVSDSNAVSDNNAVEKLTELPATTTAGTESLGSDDGIDDGTNKVSNRTTNATQRDAAPFKSEL